MYLLCRSPTNIVFLWLPLKYPIIYSFQIKVENHVTKFYLEFAVKNVKIYERAYPF